MRSTSVLPVSAVAHATREGSSISLLIAATTARQHLRKMIHAPSLGLVAICCLFLSAEGFLTAPSSFVRMHTRQRSSVSPTLFLAQSDNTQHPNAISADRVYFDIAVQGQAIGRLVFCLSNPSPLPMHAENLVQLAQGSQRSIDPLAYYVGCEFDFSPATIQDGMGRYRWGHTLRGRGRNAVGRPDQALTDPVNQLAHTHTCFGGQYYGDVYDPDALSDGDPGVLLTVPVLGPGRGSSKFSIVRVGESPREWGDRLLMNAGVIGKMDPACLPVLLTMTQHQQGPPTIAAAGVLKEDGSK
jgi:hypothetical protein